MFNALDRLVKAYGSECKRTRQDLSIAETQLRDYKESLGKSFAHEEYLNQLTELRDWLKAGLSASGQSNQDTMDLAERIKALKFGNSMKPRLNVRALSS